ncbi:hypothetical protein [Methylophilus sp. 3sh_L]|uniref:hypothetical protein n=1 Tax=Methylophilus sp. 3sh_L TaxID=3377114 RepID=UPI00398E65C2
MIKTVRIFFWVLVISAVLVQLWQEYDALQWRHPLKVALYPINADQSETSASYIASLRAEDFEPLATFFSREAAKYQLPLRRPITFYLGPEIQAVPPPPPAVQAPLYEIIVWSLQFRWFAWRHQPAVGMPVDIKLYLLYHDPARHRHLRHSTALHKGRIGRVNLFAENSQHPVNAIIVAHELLHTLSATDKYDLNTHQPLFPQGYAEPYAQPLYPQSMAEVMAGQVPQSAQISRMAKGLDQVVIGRPTAREIGWLR